MLSGYYFAAFTKGAEIGAGAARYVEITAARIGELQEQLKTNQLRIE